MILKELVQKLDRHLTILKKEDQAKNLIIGNPEMKVKGILISMSLSDAVIKKAKAEKKNLILCYNAVCLCGTCPTFHELIKNDIAVYTVKADLETSSNGYENLIASALGLKNPTIADLTYEEACYKLVTCVPKQEEDFSTKIRLALGKIGVDDGPQGAGYIGTYSQVSDCMYGHQWFVTMPGADPYIGAVGDLSKVDVERFEMIIPEHQVEECVAKLWEIHPYEEVENDVYKIAETRNHKGYGRMGTIDAVSAKDFAKKVKSIVDVKGVCEASAKIEKVGVFGWLCCDVVKTVFENKLNAVVAAFISTETALKLQANGVTVVLVDELAAKKLSLEALNTYANGLAPSAYIEEKAF